MRIRQEDLLHRFLMGIGNDKAKIHIELNKDPKTIEEAVQEVITYMETPKYPQHEDEQYFNKRRFVRQVMRTEKGTYAKSPAAPRSLGNNFCSLPLLL
jgi:uncharacterized protein (DUF2267 family)